jgi:predicted DNA-binding protein (MmcQ/YjbR family)
LAPAAFDPLSRLRALCDGLSGAEEVAAWGHPTFRAGGRTFAAYEAWKGRPSIAIRMDPGEQELLVANFGFFRTPYAGKQGWASIWADGPLPWDLLEDLLRKAHLAATQAPSVKRGQPKNRP